MIQRTCAAICIALALALLVTGCAATSSLYSRSPLPPSGNYESEP
jgi:hypothetical protein